MAESPPPRRRSEFFPSEFINSPTIPRGVRDELLQYEQERFQPNTVEDSVQTLYEHDPFTRPGAIAFERPSVLAGDSRELKGISPQPYDSRTARFLGKAPLDDVLGVPPAQHEYKTNVDAILQLAAEPGDWRTTPLWFMQGNGLPNPIAGSAKFPSDKSTGINTKALPTFVNPKFLTGEVNQLNLPWMDKESAEGRETEAPIRDFTGGPSAEDYHRKGRPMPSSEEVRFKADAVIQPFGAIEKALLGFASAGYEEYRPDIKPVEPKINWQAGEKSAAVRVATKRRNRRAK